MGKSMVFRLRFSRENQSNENIKYPSETRVLVSGTFHSAYLEMGFTGNVSKWNFPCI
jgi:hypothetical protein